MRICSVSASSVSAINGAFIMPLTSDAERHTDLLGKAFCDDETRHHARVLHRL